MKKTAETATQLLHHLNLPRPNFKVPFTTSRCQSISSKPAARAAAERYCTGLHLGRRTASTLTAAALTSPEVLTGSLAAAAAGKQNKAKQQTYGEGMRSTSRI